MKSSACSRAQTGAGSSLHALAGPVVILSPCRVLILAENHGLGTCGGLCRSPRSTRTGAEEGQGTSRPPECGVGCSSRLGLLVVLFAVAASDAHLALAAALVYALAYTLELGLSMVAYFGGGR